MKVDAYFSLLSTNKERVYQDSRREAILQFHETTDFLLLFNVTSTSASDELLHLNSTKLRGKD
ncbi:hypothetical protein SDJN02_09200, partial [Cucurbita argyrosperma subsp. argyrosperma]